jgi:hypothetical protein
MKRKRSLRPKPAIDVTSDTPASNYARISPLPFTGFTKGLPSRVPALSFLEELAHSTPLTAFGMLNAGTAGEGTVIVACECV